MFQIYPKLHFILQKNYTKLFMWAKQTESVQNFHSKQWGPCSNVRVHAPAMRPPWKWADSSESRVCNATHTLLAFLTFYLTNFLKNLPTTVLANTAHKGRTNSKILKSVISANGCNFLQNYEKYAEHFRLKLMHGV